MASKTITILILLLTVSVIYCANWGWYMADLTKLNSAQKTALINNMDSETGGKFSKLKYYVYNSTDPAISTRLIVEYYDTIESRPFYQTLVSGGIVQKIMSASREGDNWIIEPVFNYLISPTSWYLINKSTGIN